MLYSRVYSYFKGNVTFLATWFLKVTRDRNSKYEVKRVTFVGSVGSTSKIKNYMCKGTEIP